MDKLKETFEPHMDQLGQAASAATIAGAIYCFSKIIQVVQTKQADKIRIHTYIDNILISAIILKHCMITDDSYKWQANVVMCPLYLIFFGVWAMYAHSKLMWALQRFAAEAVVLAALLGYAYYKEDDENFKDNFEIATSVIIVVLTFLKVPELAHMFKNKSICLSGAGTLDSITAFMAVLVDVLWVCYAIAAGQEFIHFIMQEVVRALFHLFQLFLVIQFDKPETA